MKRCTKCGVEKEKINFHKDSSRSDRLFPQCKLCRIRPKKERKTRPIEACLSNYKVSSRGCWEWQGVINKDGYGLTCFKGKAIRAHRLSFIHASGLSNGDFLVLHKCDNRRCINPDHLYAGDAARNSLDAKERNRFNPAIGVNQPLSKINDEIAMKIYTDERPHAEIANDYCVSKSTVSAVKTKRRWKHIHK